MRRNQGVFHFCTTQQRTPFVLRCSAFRPSPQGQGALGDADHISWYPDKARERPLPRTRCGNSRPQCRRNFGGTMTYLGKSKPRTHAHPWESMLGSASALVLEKTVRQSKRVRCEVGLQCRCESTTAKRAQIQPPSTDGACPLQTYM